MKNPFIWDVHEEKLAKYGIRMKALRENRYVKIGNCETTPY